MNSYRSKQPTKQGKLSLSSYDKIEYHKAVSSEKIKRTHNFIPNKND